jgi:hypothetical protein
MSQISAAPSGDAAARTALPAPARSDSWPIAMKASKKEEQGESASRLRRELVGANLAVILTHRFRRRAILS